MRFLTIDHGAWLARTGLGAKARMYTIGNPLIAWTMIKHDLGVGLNVPVRLMIYEDAGSGTVRLAYDLPSSLMSRLGVKRSPQQRGSSTPSWAPWRNSQQAPQPRTTEGSIMRLSQHRNALFAVYGARLDSIALGRYAALSHGRCP
jgi:hypothetical protein